MYEINVKVNLVLIFIRFAFVIPSTEMTTRNCYSVNKNLTKYNPGEKSNGNLSVSAVMNY